MRRDDAPEAREASGVLGTDDWVAEMPSRVLDRGALARAVGRVPFAARIGALGVLAALLPVLTSNDYVIRIGFNTLVYVLLALGLNVIVGWAGMLDLGYFAAFGFGAYLYAILSSSRFGLHWPAEVTLPLVLAATAALGLFLSLPSRRVSGDYFAIVTLFVGEIFLTLATNSSRIDLPFVGHAVDLTGGPNGIVDIDNLRLFGLEVESVTGYFYFALVTAAVVAFALHLANDSRTGRAWRAMREDPLAAELAGMPTAWLKMLAFAFGAAVAGLTGGLFAALNTAVFPSNFGLPLLITIYAMIMLGGIGSQTGVIVGVIVVNVLLELLRTPEHARWVFYLALTAALLATVRPWARLLLLVAATVAFGFAVGAISGAVWETTAPDGANSVQAWLVHPPDGSDVAKLAYLGLILAILALLRLRGLARDAVAVVALYLAVFEWETVLVEQPSVTRVILLGAALSTLIVARPQGILGQPRVEPI
jgi:ABC-type branched-subunit amino acid transport system permease subunit